MACSSVHRIAWLLLGPPIVAVCMQSCFGPGLEPPGDDQAERSTTMGLGNDGDDALAGPADPSTTPGRAGDEADAGTSDDDAGTDLTGP